VQENFGEEAVNAKSRNVKPLRVGREAARYLLRLPEELMRDLRIDATLNGRSLNSEILTRLQLSLEQQARLMKESPRLEEPARAEYRGMSDTERQLFDIVRHLSAERQLALISLFK
jgi:hypothetical protein